MGAILNRFDDLMELQSNPKELNRFKMTAIIVHNPMDKELCDYIRERFLNLSEITGKNMLFFTFLQPKSISLCRNYSEEIYKYATFWRKGDKLDNSIDTEIAPLLRKYFQISDDHSYLILSESLLDSKPYKVQITKNTLADQFMDLRDYCDNPGDIKDLLMKLEAEAFDAKDAIIESLLKISVLLIPKPQNGECSLFFWAEIKYAERMINEIKQKLLDDIHCFTDDQADKVIQIYQLFEKPCQNIFMKYKDVQVQKCENFDKLSSESKKFWNTYATISVALPNNDKPLDGLDYSAFILCLGKIIEKELNLSIGQMLRQSMGIEMPQYYNKPCPQKGTCVIPTARENININQYINGRSNRRELKGIALGQLLHAYKTAIGTEESSHHDWCVVNENALQAMPDEFLILWDEFAKVRNGAAHSGESTFASYNEALNKYKSFVSHFLVMIDNIKHQLGPNRNRYCTIHR